jgi:choloylglycine hydrolase
MIALLLLFITGDLGCSDFQLKTLDGSIVCGRSMDFMMPMDSKIVVFKRQDKRVSMAPDGSAGWQWTSRFGFIGVNAFNFDNVDEGINEKGLTCGLLVLDSTYYPVVPRSEFNRSLMIMDTCTWILGSFSTIDDVYRNWKSVRVWGNTMPVLNIVFGLHIVVHDALGENLVIEFLNGRSVFYHNVLGVLTNDPPLSYHLQNLATYASLSQYSVANITINGFPIMGDPATGMESMPGSWSSVDRFIRIATLIRFMKQPVTAIEGILTATHILNSVYTAPGMVADIWHHDEVFISTRWGSMKDLTNRIFYYRHHDGVIRAIYLDKINFTASTIQLSVPICDSSPFILDATSDLN